MKENDAFSAFSASYGFFFGIDIAYVVGFNAAAVAVVVVLVIVIRNASPYCFNAVDVFDVLPST